MKPWESVREYKNCVTLAKNENGYATYVAYDYKEYKADGRIVTGTEDFSTERLRKYDFDWYWMWTPTGKLNKGGFKVWKNLGCVFCKNSIDAKTIASIKYPGLLIQIRR